MAGARSVLHYGARWFCFKKAAQLNAAKFLLVYLDAVFWASALCLTGKYGDLLDFVVSMF
jgi:APA family basic amino acid/polyamine antiporter